LGAISTRAAASTDEGNRIWSWARTFKKKAQMPNDNDDLRVVDAAHLTDADWGEINRLREIYEREGQEALSAALVKLVEQDPIRAAHVVGAFIPDQLRETIKDEMAKRGITEEDFFGELVPRQDLRDKLS
jgi:hypothetical protein